MKYHSIHHRALILALGMALLASGPLAAGPGRGCGANGHGKGQGACGTIEKTAVSSLSDAEIQTLQLMHEEEKLAHEVYVHLHGLYKDRPFANISEAESRHMGALAALLEAYGLEDKAATEPGKFNHPELQVLYDRLVSLGNGSRAEAFAVGVLIEETDIADLDAAIASTGNPDLVEVYTRLRDGSYRHLKAFKSGLNRVSADPESVYREAAKAAGIAQLDAAS